MSTYFKIVDGVSVPLTDQEIEALEAERAIEQAKIELYNTTEKYKDLRRGQYPTTNDLIVALWERIVEDRADSSEQLQLIRETIKQQFPKPQSE